MNRAELQSADGAADAESVFVVSALALEEWLESVGWGEAPIVLALHTRHPYGRDADALTYGVLGEGDPYDVLQEVDCGDDLHALVVAAEGWAWPPDLPENERSGRPSGHPRRVEVRTVIVLDRAGETITVTRPRGGEPVVEVGGAGPLVDAMAETLGG